MKARRITAWAPAALLAATSPALAHTGVGDTHGFIHGFMHPVGGLDHVLAMVAVGILAHPRDEPHPGSHSRKIPRDVQRNAARGGARHSGVGRAGDGNCERRGGVVYGSGTNHRKGDLGVTHADHCRGLRTGLWRALSVTHGLCPAGHGTTIFPMLQIQIAGSFDTPDANEGMSATRGGERG